MEDYVEYLDFSSVHLGAIAEEMGDYNSAYRFYSKALGRLMHYQGDSMTAIMYAQELRGKLSRTSGSGFNMPLLNFEKWLLTKSSYVKGNQCIKYLYLDQYNKKDRTPPNEARKALFNLGHDFEDRFRAEKFPGGINVKEKVRSFNYFNSYTKYLLKRSGPALLYEATILEEDVLIMVDVLVKNDNDTFDFYEVKANTNLNVAIKNDVALQYYICKKRFGEKIKSFNIVLRGNSDSGNYKIMDVTSEMESKINEVRQKILSFKNVLRSTMPTLSIGEHCNSPYDCDFKEFCSRQKDYS
ncbi:hypothetical protein [Chryseobacterium sp. 5_R23647]|uniref:hypothetical protein n=1 Tax=Chryseobacterium sp. 5_R23647 TaxID=2258964 RepID=UPI000E26CADC|nr:hypothetical protein [Chryseobacterium sp. 5_R23647]REC42588.1 hypothetical protein DRF69_11060 [Chryseobacterium sp. 5_R23647]